MKTYAWWNDANLGDCFWHCLFMRRLAVRRPDDSFVLYCKTEHLGQLRDVICDLPNVLLKAWIPGTPCPEGARPAWIGHYQRQHPLWKDVIAFLIEWFQHLAACDGLDSPIVHRRDLLADYPALHESGYDCVESDWLVINSQPMSGQFAFDHNDLNVVVGDLLAAGHSVVTTVDTGHIDARTTAHWWDRMNPRQLTITEIGALSCGTGNVLAVATGPIWPTFNIWNQRQHKHRIVLLNDVTINYGDPMEHFGSVGAAHQYLREQGVI